MAIINTAEATLAQAGSCHGPTIPIWKKPSGKCDKTLAVASAIQVYYRRFWGLSWGRWRQIG
ncbi:MAG: hypothetical protein ACFFCW_06980 [Candidatus Hodarchaeota archaeon]